MITVFTPTYNRGKLLYKLWESLEEQEYRDFEWVVVDDGSTDETEAIIEEIKEKATFPLVYLKKINEGKHIAINEGGKLASGEWFFTVDSDDYLSRDALLLIHKYCSQIESDLTFAGVSGLCGNPKGEVLSSYLKNNKLENNQEEDYLKAEFIDADYEEYKYIIKAGGDRAEVVRTDLVRQYPFPKFGDEKFLVESYFWMTLAYQGLKFRWFNEVIYIAEYRDDGLTRNIASVYRKSPIGAYKVANLRLTSKRLPLKLRIKSEYNYFRFGRIAKVETSDLWKDCNDKLFAPVGMLLAFIRP